jgi:hypothetical protein
MFKKDTSKETSKTQEKVRVPNYGDIKIDEAKGNPPEHSLSLNRLFSM